MTVSHSAEPLPRAMLTTLGCIAIMPIVKAILSQTTSNHLIAEGLVEITTQPFGFETYPHLQITPAGCEYLAARRRSQ